jgi:hypothetical protein
MDANSKIATTTGYVMSGLVITFMLFDSTMKLAAMDVVLKASADLGYPATAAFARELGLTALVCTVLYAWPRTSIVGAVLLTAYMGGTVATHLRAGNPLFTHMLFGVYLALLAWGGLYLREPRLRVLLPLRAKAGAAAVPARAEP